MFDKYISFLRVIPLLQNLNDNEFASLLPYFHIQNFKKGSLIISDNAETDFFYIIYEGKVLIYKEEQNIIEELAIKGPGEFFGEIAFIDNFRRSASVKALEDLILFSLDKTGFYKLLSFPESSIVLLKNIARDLRKQNENYIKRIINKVEEVRKRDSEIEKLKYYLFPEGIKRKIFHVSLEYIFKFHNPIYELKKILSDKNNINNIEKYNKLINKYFNDFENYIINLILYSKNAHLYNYENVNINEIIHTIKNIFQLYFKTIYLINIKEVINGIVNTDKNHFIIGIVYLFKSLTTYIQKNYHQKSENTKLNVKINIQSTNDVKKTDIVNENKDEYRDHDNEIYVKNLIINLEFPDSDLIDIIKNFLNYIKNFDNKIITIEELKKCKDFELELFIFINIFKNLNINYKIDLDTQLNSVIFTFDFNKR